MTRLVLLTGRSQGKSVSTHRMLEQFEAIASNLRSMWTEAAKAYRRKHMDKYAPGKSPACTPASQGGWGHRISPWHATDVTPSMHFNTKVVLSAPKKERRHHNGKPKKPWE